MSNFNKVKIFMETFGQKVETKPSFPEPKIQNLRYELIREELEELKVALEEKNLKEVVNKISTLSEDSFSFVWDKLGQEHHTTANITLSHQ